MAFPLLSDSVLEIIHSTSVAADETKTRFKILVKHGVS